MTGASHEAERPGVSVALRAFNSERYVGEQLRSVLAQTLRPTQIVVGDDGSTDATLELIGRMASIDAIDHPDLPVEWTILPSEHLGIGPNIERTMAACTEDLVLLCDHDDISLPTRFERIARALAEPGVLLVHSDAELIDSGGERLDARLLATQGWAPWERAAYDRGDAFSVLIRRSLATGATVGFRRELLDLAGPTPPVFVYDEWLAITAAALDGTRVLDERLLEYRQHPSNKTGVRRRGLGEKMRLLRSPGAARNERLHARAEALVARLTELGDAVGDARLATARDKLAYEGRRARMPRNRLLRAPGVLRAARSGAYSRFARGRKDLLLDLVQPLESTAQRS